jgi:hypothetical protein
MNDLRLVLVAAAFAVTACQSASPPAASAPPPAASAPPPSAPAAPGPGTAYYQYVGSKQCERGGKSPQELQRELAAAGVQVPQVTCGHDGRMYAQACGGPDGRIFVVLVPQEKGATLARLGFKPMAELPNAVPLACR